MSMVAANASFMDNSSGKGLPEVSYDRFPSMVVPGDDLGDRLDGPVDLVDGVVEGEAEAATRRRVEPQGVVRQGRAVAAGPGLDAAPVQPLGQGERANSGEVEGDQGR